MKTVEQAWKELGVDDDMPPPDEFINRWFDALENAANSGAAREEAATGDASADSYQLMVADCGK